MNIEKSELRINMKKIMSELDSAYMKKSDKSITDSILNSHLYRNARTIFTFITMGREIDVIPLIEDALNNGKIVCGPKCFRDKHMEAREIKGLDDVVQGFMNIPEPKDSCPPIPKEDIDLVFVPCLAADTRGFRLGYGAGYYDRYLEYFEGQTVLLCREKQMLENVPVEKHDVSVDTIVTENGLVEAL